MKFLVIVSVLLFSSNLFAFDGEAQFSGKIELHKTMIKETKNHQELINFLEDKAQILTDPNFKAVLEEKRQEVQDFILHAQNDPLWNDIKDLSHVQNAQDAIGKITKILTDIPAEINYLQKVFQQFSCCKGA